MNKYLVKIAASILDQRPLSGSLPKSSLQPPAYSSPNKASVLDASGKLPKNTKFGNLPGSGSPGPIAGTVASAESAAGKVTGKGGLARRLLAGTMKLTRRHPLLALAGAAVGGGALHSAGSSDGPRYG